MCFLFCFVLIKSPFNLTWLVGSISAAWTCSLRLWSLLFPVLLDTDDLLSPTLWGVTLPVLPELDLLCPVLLLGNPPTPDPMHLAWLSWALIRSFCLLSWAISARMASGESREPRGSEVCDIEEVEGRLRRGRLVRLEAELWDWTSSQECGLSTEGILWCGGIGWVTEEERGEQLTE